MELTDDETTEESEGRETPYEELEMNVESEGPSAPKRIKRGFKEVLTMKLSLLLDRCKVSDRNATRIILATVEALGEDPKEYKISRSVIREQRRINREKYTEQIQDRLKIPQNEAVCVHWDGKLLPGILKTEQKERVAVLVSHGTKEQLLGVPETDSSSGEEQALAVYECLEEWGLASSVVAMCFDTTASNTGRLNGACNLLEQMLGRELLYLACRHHVLEVLLRGVFDCKFGSTSGPQPDIFKRFQKEWSAIDKSKFDVGENVLKLLPKEEVENIKEELQRKLMECQPRDDYKELLQLALIYLGHLDGKDVRFRSPGPVHHARWMAKAIYCLKIQLFRDQFKLTSQEQEALEALCVFIVRVYCKTWFNAPRACLAPKQDLDLIENLLKYESIDKKISEKGINKMINHLWYLSPELVALALFDPTVQNTVKSQMATKILTNQAEENEKCSRNMRPKLKKEQLPKSLEKGLPALITSETYLLFKRLNINTEFLEKDPATWPQNINYQEGQRMVNNLKVVNDMAERGVKLITDYNQLLTKDEQQKQYVLQVVSRCRQLYPDSSKTTLCQSLE